MQRRNDVMVMVMVIPLLLLVVSTVVSGVSGDDWTFVGRLQIEVADCVVYCIHTYVELLVLLFVALCFRHAHDNLSPGFIVIVIIYMPKLKLLYTYDEYIDFFFLMPEKMEIAKLKFQKQVNWCQHQHVRITGPNCFTVKKIK